MEMSIYIATLNAYNKGEVRGAWLELPLCAPCVFAEEFPKWLKENVGGTGCEIAVYDYDCEVDIAKEFGEYPDIEDLNDLALELEELESWEVDTFKALMEYGCDPKRAVEAAKNGDVYLVPDVWDDDDYGRYIVEEGLMGDIPENLQNYINYEKLGRDCRLEGDIYFSKYGCLCGLNNL